MSREQRSNDHADLFLLLRVPSGTTDSDFIGRIGQTEKTKVRYLAV